MESENNIVSDVVEELGCGAAGSDSFLMRQSPVKHGEASGTGASRATTALLLLCTLDQQSQFAGSAMLELASTSTKAGKSRERMQWTNEINEHIMCYYYMIIKLESYCLRYRSKFIEKFPQFPHLTERRIAELSQRSLQELLIENKEFLSL